MRPSTVHDLPEASRRGHEVLTIDTRFLLRLPTKVVARILDLIDALEEHAGELFAEVQEQIRAGSTATIVVPLTDDELSRALRSAQESWDWGKRRYEEALDPTKRDGIEAWMHYNLDGWAEREGMPAIEWEADQ